MKNLVICGGGSSSHTLIPLLKDSGFDVSIYTSRPEKWSNKVELEWRDPEGNILGNYEGDLKTISNRPEEVISSADYIVFCMPVHKYRVCLHQIAPYINRNKKVFIGTVYGQGGWNHHRHRSQNKGYRRGEETCGTSLFRALCPDAPHRPGHGASDLCRFKSI